MKISAITTNRSLFLLALLSLSSVSSIHAASFLATETFGTFFEGDIQYDRDATPSHGPHGTLNIKLESGEVYEITNGPPGWAKGKVSGASRISLPPGLAIAGGKIDMKGGAPSSVDDNETFARQLATTSEQERNLSEVRRTLQSSHLTLGTRTVVAVRVVAQDASYENSESSLRDNVFGGNGDVRNLKSQYNACSYGQLKFNAIASDVMSTDPNNESTDVVNGVATVEIPYSITGLSAYEVGNYVTAELNKNFGDASSIADHVMYCLPPGTTLGGTKFWAAYGLYEDFMSVYNNNYCNSLQAQMHAIGTNLSFRNSGEDSTGGSGASFGDETCMMGYIDSEDDGPAMCFNGVKSWYTFWYRDKMRSVSSSDTTNSFSGDIYGIANYDTSPGRVIVRIEDPFTSQNDHFVMFNRKTGINSGVVEAGDQVTVTRGDSFIESDLRAKLSAGESYVATFDGKPWTIQVNAINTFDDPGYATINIFHPTPSPTPKPVSAPAPTKSPPCMAASTMVPTPTGLVRVDELEAGAQVMGITTEGLQKPDCAVVGIGMNGVGTVFGNYTVEHFILNEEDMVVEYGSTAIALSQAMRNDSLFDILLDCPFGVDESGIKYSAMANYHSMETHYPNVTFADHLAVYYVLLGLVRETGSFWLFSDSYEDIEDAKIRRGQLVDLMMECLSLGEGAPVCDEMEAAAAEFVEVQFPADGRRALMGDGSAARYADVIREKLPRLGEAGGGEGTAAFALRQEVARRGNGKVPAVLGTLAGVAGVAIVALIAVSRNLRRNKEPAPAVADSGSGPTALE